MKNIYDVLKAKEAELAQLQKEIDALQIAASLLAEESEPQVEALAVAAPAAMPRVVSSTATREAAAPWPASPRQFP